MKQRVMVLTHFTSTNEIYLPTKFIVDTACSFRIMALTKICGWKDIGTDKTATKKKITLSFGEH